MINEWTVAHGKHQIRVVRTSSDSARLCVDDELLDSTNDLFASGDEAALVGVFGDENRIEAFVTPTAEPSIRVNGHLITGKAYALASD